MTEAQRELTRKRCVEDGDLLAEGPAALAPEKQSRQWGKLAANAISETTSTLTHGVRRAIGTGALMNHICEEGKRLGIIPHGQFGQWLEKHVPQIPWRTIYRWRDLATQTVERLQNCHDGNFDGAGYLAVYRAAFGNGNLTKAELALRDKLDDLIQGRTQNQLFLEFKNVEEAPTGETVVVHGGDRAWDSFIRKKHPELIVNGRVPKRGQVEQSVRDELAQITAKGNTPSPEELAQQARNVLEEWVQASRRLLAHADLPRLMPQEFPAVLSLADVLRERFKQLQGRFRKPAGRKRKRAAAPPFKLPEQTLRSINGHLKGPRESATAGDTASLKGAND